MCILHQMNKTMFALMYNLGTLFDKISTSIYLLTENSFLRESNVPKSKTLSKSVPNVLVIPLIFLSLNNF